MSEIGIKIPVVKTAEYIIYLEKTPWNDLFIHVDFNGKWTKQNKLNFLEAWNNLCNSINEPIFAMPFVYDSKMQKFMKLCNLVKLADVVCGDGVTRAVHIWRK